MATPRRGQCPAGASTDSTESLVLLSAPRAGSHGAVDARRMTVVACWATLGVARPARVCHGSSLTVGSR